MHSVWSRLPLVFEIEGMKWWNESVYLSSISNAGERRNTADEEENEL